MFGLTPEQLTTIAGAAGIISAVIALVGLPALVLGWHNHLVKRLDDNAVIRERLATALSAPSLTALYATSLAWGLDRLERWMGGYRDLGRGYGWCVAIAMAYAATFILLPWGLAGRGTGLGDWVLIPDSVQSWWQRGVALFVIVIGATMLVLANRQGDAIDAYVDQALRSLLQRMRFISNNWAARIFLGVLVFASVFSTLLILSWAIGVNNNTRWIGFLSAVASFGAMSGFATITITIAICIGAGTAVETMAADAEALTGKVIGAVLVAILISSSFTAIFTFNNKEYLDPLIIKGLILIFLSFSILPLAYVAFADANALETLGGFLFMVILPYVNALLDWPSWLVSRWLGRHLLDGLDGSRLRQLRNFVLHGVADLLAAVGFLVLLAIILPRAVGLFVDLVVWLAPSLDAAVAPYICATARDPLGAGFWASAMLLSTLLPTALHLMFLVASPIAFWLRPHGADWQARAAYLAGDRAEPPEIDLPRNPSLRDAELEKAGLNRETVRKVAWWRIRQIFLIYPAAFVAAGLILWGIWHLIQAVTGPLPAWLLWFATFDSAFVEACLPGAF